VVNLNFTVNFYDFLRGIQNDSAIYILNSLEVISNQLTSELLSLSSLSLCPVCPLWFNHFDTTEIDINAIKLMVSAIKNVLVVEKVVRVVNNLLFHLFFPLVQWESAAVPRVTAIPKPISIRKVCCFRL
jgi:hypothetical protein